jgi:hypothetical protein
MRRRTVLALALACTLSLGGCGFDIFENVETDPHPPRIFDLVVSPTTIKPETGLNVQVGYADDGADITTFILRDRDSSSGWSIVPAAPVPEDPKATPDPAPEFFPGTAGIMHTVKPLITNLRQEGAHRIEIWAEDSHGSRSDKIEFVITVII